MSSKEKMLQNSVTMMNQTGENMEDYLVSMRQVSDTIYYNVIKENDFGNSKSEIQDKMNLLYESDKDNLRSIAIYNSFGSLIAAEPGCFPEGGSRRYPAGVVCEGNGRDGEYEFFISAYPESV